MQGIAPTPSDSPDDRNRDPRGTHVSFTELVAAITGVLLRAGVSPETADILAWNHACCERDGALSHGVFRIPQYIETLRTGYLNGAASPRLERVTSSYIRVDADGGIAQLALSRAGEMITKAVAEEGVAVVAIRNSHHHSALWPDLEPLAEAGYVALTTVTGGVPTVAPMGVSEPVLSTNPFAFAVPIAGAPPLIADFATSSMSFGDLTLAAHAGRVVPRGTGVDARGQETTDAAAIAEGGMLLPFGGHKGAALSIMVELLASALTGGAFSIEACAGKPEGAHSSRTGQFLLVLDPDRGAAGDFAPRAATLTHALRAAGMDRLPADQRYKHRTEAQEKGIPVTPAIRELLG